MTQVSGISIPDLQNLAISLASLLDFIALGSEVLFCRATKIQDHHCYFCYMIHMQTEVERMLILKVERYIHLVYPILNAPSFSV